MNASSINCHPERNEAQRSAVEGSAVVFAFAFRVAGDLSPVTNSLVREEIEKHTSGPKGRDHLIDINTGDESPAYRTKSQYGG
jgi:hypothetical protein